jgi:alkylhydroperoxidase family enzyme
METPMRIPDWSQAAHPQPTDLINLDKALLWSEPLARGWNVYLKAVRTELPTSRKLRELAICTVALLTGAAYEYHHHAPDFIAAGGTQVQLDALQAQLSSYTGLGNESRQFSDVDIEKFAIESIVIQYAGEMTRNVAVRDTTFSALQKHFDTTQIVELTSAIATYNMVARFLVALGVTPEATPAPAIAA